MYQFSLIQLLLFTNNALLGEIEDNVRSIQIKFDNELKQIYFWFFFSGPISDEDKETAKDIYDAALDQCDLSFQVFAHFLRVDYPQPVPNKGISVFLRDESSLPYGNVTPYFTKAGTLVVFDLIENVFASITLRLQDALLGKSRQNLRAIQADIDENKKILYFWFFFDGPISHYDKQIVRAITDEVKDHYVDFRFEEKIYQYDFPSVIPAIGNFVFLKNEKKKQRAGDIPLSKDLTNTFTSFLYGVCEGLLQKITPNLRAVKIDIDELEKTCYIWFFYDGEISSIERELATRKLSYLPYSFKQMQYLERLDFPALFPHRGKYAYLRYEPSTIGRPVYSQHREETDDIFSLSGWGERYQALYSLKLRIHMSLLGKVKPHLRAVKTMLNLIEKQWFLWMYYDGEINHNEFSCAKDLSDKISSQIDCNGVYYVERFDMPQKIPHVGVFVYERYEGTQGQNQ